MAAPGQPSPRAAPSPECTSALPTARTGRRQRPGQRAARSRELPRVSANPVLALPLLLPAVMTYGSPSTLPRVGSVARLAAALGLIAAAGCTSQVVDATGAAGS